MSGGHFDYQQYRIGDIAEGIQELIDTNDSQELDEYGYPVGRDYAPEVIEEFRRAVALLKQAQVYVHRIDWLVSGDDGEDNFFSRLQADLKELE